LQVERSLPERLAILEQVYGDSDPADLILATERIAKRIGGQQTKSAIDSIQSGDRKPAIAIALDYYDKTYLYDLQRRGVMIIPVAATGLTDQAVATHLLGIIDQMGDPRLSVTISQSKID
jgi:tRNA 2-selenouridine synthase